ncbi:MAG TPA: hypothetical protein PLV50_03050 [Smithella sp.]|nr:hypothetical protein [Smithella sp.]HOG89489.1 hypothetical protein [Smithella sp.]
MIDWNTVAITTYASAICFALGFMLGDFLAHKRIEKKKQEQAEAEKQMQMWNDYLEALKGGQNAK